MSDTNIPLAGFAFDSDGNAVESATISVFPRNTTASATDTTTTNSSGYWAVAESTQGRYDAQITHPTDGTITRLKYDDAAQLKSLDVADLYLRTANDTHAHKITVADDTGWELNIPALDTDQDFVFSQLAQTLVGKTLSNAGNVLIGDTATADVTLGLHIDQGANDDFIATFASDTDVTHPFTDEMEAGSYFGWKKEASTQGGVRVFALKATDGGSAFRAFRLDAGAEDIDTSTAATTSSGVIELRAHTDSGSALGEVNDSGWLLAIRNHDDAQFLYRGDGSSFANVTCTTFQDHDDLALIAELEKEIVAPYGDSSPESRRAIEQLDLVGKGSWGRKRGKGRAMVNTAKENMLHRGAFRQVRGHLGALAAVLTDDQKRALPRETQKALGL